MFYENVNPVECFTIKSINEKKLFWNPEYEILELFVNNLITKTSNFVNCSLTFIIFDTVVLSHISQLFDFLKNF